MYQNKSSVKWLKRKWHEEFESYLNCNQWICTYKVMSFNYTKISRCAEVTPSPGRRECLNAFHTTSIIYINCMKFINIEFMTCKYNSIIHTYIA